MYSKELFKGEVILVTCGGTGIGYGIAELFIELGGLVIITSRDKSNLEKSSKNLSNFVKLSSFPPLKSGVSLLGVEIFFIHLKFFAKI